MTAPGYPVLLQLANRLCVVVGGGRIAERRILGLLAVEARVRVVAPEILPAIAAAAPAELYYRPFTPEDLLGAWLAFAATDDPEVNQAVVVAARQAGIPVNRADVGLDGDFLLPAVLRRGNLTLSVASDGGSPALTTLIRDRLARAYGPEWGDLCTIAAALRQKQLTGVNENAYNQSVLAHLLDDEFMGLLAAGNAVDADRHLAAVLGDDTSLASLGVCLTKGMK